MELIKDYDFTPQYHLGKANVVANALSRKPSHGRVRKVIRKANAKLLALHCSLWRDIQDIVFGYDLNESSSGCVRFLGNMKLQSTLCDRVVEFQSSDSWIGDRVLEIEDGSIKDKGWSIEADG